ncbi:MAG: M15 family metallopeptidase [Halanaerobacter sp.]
MVSIEGHQLVKEETGWQILLYVDAQLMEAADEFEAVSKNKKDLRKIVDTYLENNLPALKVNVIKVLLGSLVIATIPLTTTSTVHDLNAQKDLKVVVKDRKITEIPAKGKATLGETKLEEKSNLLLVNKDNSLAKNYNPLNLIVPDVPFSFDGFHEKKLMQAKAAAALERLFAEAEMDNIDLYAVSGYRSYQRQEVIFRSQVARYGLRQANQVSARPGESEHQTGLAIDLTSPKVNFKLVQEFGATKEGQWLQDYAGQFGFIIRYPAGKEGITGYQYEPWHIRYVGSNIAQKIMSQRLTLEEYLA